MIRLKLPCTPLVYKYFKKNYPDGYKICTKTFIDKGIYLALVHNKKMTNVFPSYSTQKYSQEVELLASPSQVFHESICNITPFTICFINDMIEESIFKSSMRTIVIHSQYVSKEMVKVNAEKGITNFYKSPLKYLNGIRKFLKEYDIEESEYSLDAIKKLITRAK